MINQQTSIEAKKVLDFWFDKSNKPYWFNKSEDFDKAIEKSFSETWQAVKACECSDWRVTLEGRLAEIIVLDQFSRNLFRESPTAFAQDGMALVLAQETIKQAGFESLSKTTKHFIFLPYMHSESSIIHEQAVPLFESLDDEQVLSFEFRHKAIIDRFGRYPHRNEVLGRKSTPEELEFLKQPNSSF